MPAKAPENNRLEQPPALKTMRLDQSDVDEDARQAKKKKKEKKTQTLSPSQTSQSPDHLGITLREDARGKATSAHLIIALPLQCSASTPKWRETNSNGECEGIREQNSDFKSLDKEESVEAQRVQASERHEEDLAILSPTLLLDEVIEKESLKLKDFGYISDEYAKGSSRARNRWLDTRQPPAKGTSSNTSAIIGEEGNSIAQDTSTERSAALIWPQCEKPCEICQATHVAIPGSTGSDACIRISLTVQNAPTDANNQSLNQSILIPTDAYELSVLGWLIWVTFAHQVALRNTTVGIPPETKRSKDYVSTEICRLDIKLRPMVSRTVHRNKSEFESWWEGKRNTKGWGGKRWLVITFPWDMGDPNIFDAKFGRMGHLFCLPTLHHLQGFGEESATIQ
jgi:hypothetical protein